jgi:homopolymeric O-antigen transport system ATP-binding protein
MSAAAVRFEGVWKRFRRGERHDSLRDLLPSLAKHLFGRSQPADLADANDFWAVRDVSFEVRPGEALGIIGPNGAGKSTTLKLLTRILRPTRGECSVAGRVGALIEIAAGFHPDLTGRENIYLQGAVMGMTRADIQRRFDAIVDFAGVGAFIETPVKRYSSGMNARLGFSIAAHLEPDVLIIDEVLAVGDVAFQQRCFDRMEQFRRDGAAIVFVSHHLDAVQRLCQRALLLDAGRATCIAPVADVVFEYMRQGRQNETAAAGAPVSVVVTPDARSTERALVPGDRIRFSVSVSLQEAVESATVGVVVWEVARGLYVYGVASDAIGMAPLSGTRGDSAVYHFELAANLTRGLYAVEVNVFEPNRQRRLAVVMPAFQFTIAEQQSYDGVANLFLRGGVDASIETSELVPA